MQDIFYVIFEAVSLRDSWETDAMNWRVDLFNGGLMCWRQRSVASPVVVISKRARVSWEEVEKALVVTGVIDIKAKDEAPAAEFAKQRIA